MLKKILTTLAVIIVTFLITVLWTIKYLWYTEKRLIGDSLVIDLVNVYKHFKDGSSNYWTLPLDSAETGQYIPVFSIWDPRSNISFIYDYISSGADDSIEHHILQTTINDTPCIEIKKRWRHVCSLEIEGKVSDTGSLAKVLYNKLDLGSAENKHCTFKEHNVRQRFYGYFEFSKHISLGYSDKTLDQLSWTNGRNNIGQTCDFILSNNAIPYFVYDTENPGRILIIITNNMGYPSVRGMETIRW